MIPHYRDVSAKAGSDKEGIVIYTWRLIMVRSAFVGLDNSKGRQVCLIKKEYSR